jgi:ABC-2 type transport system ATP-binding protein
MDEAEKLCDRVAVVDHGQVIAMGSPRELMLTLGGDHVIDISAAPNALGPLRATHLEGLPAVKSVHEEAGPLVLNVAEPHLASPPLFDRLRAGGFDLLSLSTRHASLEDVFVALTGRHLRDA